MAFMRTSGLRVEMSVEGVMACRRRCGSPPPLEDDDLLSEILLRLSPLPSSLPRASLVCKRWRMLVSDCGFLRRFRARHRRSAPVLGFFHVSERGLVFAPTLEAPNRVPSERFSFQFDDEDRLLLLSCRDGLVLIVNRKHRQILVLDPVTGDRRHLAVPQGFNGKMFHGAVLRSAGDVPGGCRPSPFQVILVAIGNGGTQALACFYSTETGMWGDLISTPLVSSSMLSRPLGVPSALIGNSLYWSVDGNPPGILEFDLDSKQLTVMPVPLNVSDKFKRSFRVMPMEGGEIGILCLSDSSPQLWKRKNDCDGVGSWVLAKTIELDKLLSLSSEKRVVFMGFSEDSNVTFLSDFFHIFMVQPESMEVKKFPVQPPLRVGYPFTSVYTADMGIDGGHDGAELLHNT